MIVSPQAGPHSTVHRVVAPAGSAGQRIDRVLASALPQLSRARIQSLIHAGCVKVNGETLVAASRRVKPGQTFVVDVPPAADPKPAGQAIPLDVVFEDDAVIVVDKPAGLVVHPAPGNPDNTLVNALIHHCGEDLVGIGGVRRPGIVHRLDKDTSGLIVAAKTGTAHRSLVEQFAAHSIERGYYALVWGIPAPSRGTVDKRVGRNPRNRKKMAVVSRGGKTAVTHYRVLGTAADGALSLVECWLETGRTHQIRVHLAHIGHAVVSDPIYGHRHGQRLRSVPALLQGAFATLSRQALHAFRLGFTHPMTLEQALFETKLPDMFEDFLNRTTASGHLERTSLRS